MPGLIFQTTLPNAFDALLLCAHTLKNSNRPDLNNREKSGVRIIFLLWHIAQWHNSFTYTDPAACIQEPRCSIYVYKYVCGKKSSCAAAAAAAALLLLNPY
jgi:hypothetical protein